MALTSWTKVACRFVPTLASRVLAGKQFVVHRYAATSAGTVLAGRRFLPGSDRKGFPKYLAEPYEGYPHVVEPLNFGIPFGTSPFMCAELIK